MATLKEEREKRGIKQGAVADAMGVTRQTYARYETQPEAMPVGYAVIACKFIGCDLDSVFFGREGKQDLPDEA